MKHIVKNIEPASFSTWKANNPGATYKEDLKKEKKVKKELKRSLINEQHHICCYCECRITESTSHIEHFKPKGNPAYSNLQLEYSNLFASCGIERSGKNEEHCGHKKYKEYNSNLISPLEPDCSTHFKYNIFGEIEHNNSKRGEETINMLNLNSALLKAQRQKLIDYFLDIDDNELDIEFSKHLDTTKVEYGEFYTMIEYFKTNKIL